MQKQILKLLTVGFILLSIVTVSCKSSATQNGVGGTLNADLFEEKLNTVENAQIADVRTPEEYAEGHVQNAVNINWNGDAFETDIQKMDKNQPIFVYCLSGGRSASAVSKMKELGFKEIYELDGGMRAWYNANKPVDAGTVSEKTKGMTMDEFNTQLKTDKLVLVDFNAEWCAPCKKMAPALHEIANEQKDKLILLEIDVDKHEEVANELKIESLPTLMLYKNGVVVWSTMGLTEKAEIMDAINKM